ncbi:OCIA domain-containing protein 1 [Chanos chanos]|uniref:OCIA domain-containing protein 1 n=1 Tax=Chanos chanos TaxID=29144 RepID=A0A6J2WEB9_CHACN|nr:OCIA domain-containing protein 1-like [Chanos chanos]
MSQASSDYTDRGGQRESSLGPLSLDYIPTEEERRVFRECGQESFWYRSVPVSVISMALTQFLISRGALTSSTRLGSLPKVAFAGVCGYLAGKMSYMKTCQEKFKNLEHSPLGEALRQRQRHIPPRFIHEQSKLNEPDKPVFEPGPQEPSYKQDFPYSDPPFLSSSSRSDSPEPAFLDDAEPREKPVLYEELRSRNRENYEVTLTRKAESLLRPAAGGTGPKKEVKKNIYGDTWEE